MIISESSWHYRLIDHMDWDHPCSLCAYFWKTVLAMIAAPARAILMIFVVAIMAVMATSPFWWWNTDSSSWFIIATAFAILEIGLLIHILRVLVIERHDEERSKGERSYKKEKQPSLLSAWISAKHRKICPFLKFERNIQ